MAGWVLDEHSVCAGRAGRGLSMMISSQVDPVCLPPNTTSFRRPSIFEHRAVDGPAKMLAARESEALADVPGLFEVAVEGDGDVTAPRMEAAAADPPGARWRIALGHRQELVSS